jgi:aquaporin Z
MMRKAAAEMLGTFWLVFGGVGSVVLWGGTADVVNVALAFGLSVVTMAYAIGHISGCHLNPAVTLGLALAGRFDRKQVPHYVAAQLLGGVAAAAVLYVMVSDLGHGTANLGANTYADGALVAAILAELLLTMFFMIVILGVTSKQASPGFAGLVIGLCLAMIHMIGVAVTGVSVNPARSLGPALFSGGVFLERLWLFLVVPPIGAALGALVHRALEPDGTRAS